MPNTAVSPPSACSFNYISINFIKLHEVFEEKIFLATSRIDKSKKVDKRKQYFNEVEYIQNSNYFYQPQLSKNMVSIL